MRNWRINLIFGLIVLAGLAILSKLFFIQVINQAFYRALAEGQQKWFIEVEGNRGEIFLKDRNGNLYVLATNVSKNLCYLRPKSIKDKEETVRVITEILGLKEEAILEKLNPVRSKSPKATAPPEAGTSNGVNQEGGETLQLLKDDLSQEELQALKEKNLPGIYCEEKRARFYPQERLAAQVAGFLGGEGKGQYGLEGFYDEILQGKQGWLTGERNPWGFSLGTLQDEARQGADLVLTLDYNIQQRAERLLQRAVKDLAAEGGEILVISPEDGKILALVNFPNFDLNYYAKIENQEIFQNGALQKLFEPGSVFKPIVMAGALEEEKIMPETTYVDAGFVKIGKDIISNYDQRIWGKRTMIEVLEKSINTGAVFAQKQLGGKNFLKYIEGFGFLEPTFIDLQGEVFSANKNLKSEREINLATASFGQGVEITLLQLARAFGAIANGGKLVRPYVVEKIVKPDGKTIETKPEIQREDIISQQTANQLTTMLVSVVEKGFAKGARVPRYYIAGKTGTAQVAFSALGIEKSGYSEKTVQSFMGFFPAFSPQFLILIKLNNPQTKTAEYSAVPIFREFAKYIIDYWEIPPDYE